MKNKKVFISFIILFIFISMYLFLDKRITNLENENIMLRDTLNEKNSFIWLNEAKTFDKEI